MDKMGQEEVPPAVQGDNISLEERGASTSLARSRRLIRAIAWPLSIVASAFLTSLFKDYWEAPRPVIQLTEFKTLDPSPGDSYLNIDPTILKAIADHPYLETLESRMKRSALRDKIREFQAERDTEGEVERYIPKIIGILQTQSAAIPLEKRRHALLQVLSDEPDQHSVIEQASKFVLDDFESRLPPGYQQHPPGTAKSMVPLSHSVYDLSEIDESKEVPGKSRIDFHRTNLFRRLFLYYNQDLLVDLFSAVQQYMHVNNDSADFVIAALSKMLDVDARKKICISVLVTNRGSRPLAVLPLGVLRLEVPSPDSSKPATVVFAKMISPDDDPNILVVEGDKAQTLHLISQETVSELVRERLSILGGEGWDQDKPLDSSRFMLLYHAKTGSLTASIILAQPGLEPNKARIGPSEVLPVTSAISQKILEELDRSWR